MTAENGLVPARDVLSLPLVSPAYLHQIPPEQLTGQSAFSFLLPQISPRKKTMIDKPLRRRPKSREDVPAYRNCELPVNARLEDLVSRMTIQEVE